MSQDPNSPYEDEYFQEIGRREDVAAALKGLSEEPIRAYLGRYGDAIDKRLDNSISMARYASQGGFPRYAIVGAVIAIEVLIRYMLIRPLLQGAFLSDSWAKILTDRITNGRTAPERELLPGVLEMYDVKIENLKLSDGSALWETFNRIIIRRRNEIIHEGDNATADECKLALECYDTLRKEIITHVAKKMGFDLEKNRSWHNHTDADGYAYEPESPF